MDIGDVTEVSGQMKTAAGNLNDAAAKLETQLGHTDWVGPDKDTFTANWDGMRKQLTAASTFLSESAKALDIEIQAQTDASRT